MRLRMMVAVMALGACCAGASSMNAQAMSMDMPAKDAAGAMSPSKALDDMLTLFEGDAMGVAKAMPAEKYGFAPSGAIFAPGQTPKFDTVRTFAGQVTHVAEANYYFYATISGLKPDVDVKKIETLTSKDDAVAALAGSFAFAHKAIATITAANAFETIKGVDGMHTRATLAAFGVAHGYDHYGQMIEYLRMNGIVPPGSK
jgi:DinB superfamily